MARVIVNIKLEFSELADGCPAIVEERSQFRGYRWKYLTLKLQPKSAISVLFYKKMWFILALAPELSTL